LRKQLSHARKPQLGKMLQGLFITLPNLSIFGNNVVLDFTGIPSLPQKTEKQVPFGFAKGRLSTTLRSAQDDRAWRSTGKAKMFLCLDCVIR
jgi:hypothetical protein